MEKYLFYLKKNVLNLSVTDVLILLPASGDPQKIVQLCFGLPTSQAKLYFNVLQQS